jgi:hypothetical protein
MDDDNDESLRKRPKMFQPQVVTSLSHISDAMRNLLGDNITPGSDKATVVVSIDRLQTLSDKVSIPYYNPIPRSLLVTLYSLPS